MTIAEYFPLAVIALFALVEYFGLSRKIANQAN